MTYLHVMGDGWDEVDPLDDRPVENDDWTAEQDRIVKACRVKHQQSVGWVWVHTCDICHCPWNRR
jgi:hypothetical protein